jgi:glutamine synthetase
LPNFSRTPEALQQLVTKESRKLLESLNILTSEEIDSRYHVRLERYVKDMLIEMHMLREMVDTLVLPAAFEYSGDLVAAAAQAKAAKVTVIPQIEEANRIGALIQDLQKNRDQLVSVIDRAESMHASLEKQAKLLTSTGANTMAAVRACCDSAEGAISDSCWPLPKYREMLFPV